MRSLPFLACLLLACGGSDEGTPDDHDAGVTPDAEIPGDPVVVNVEVSTPPATIIVDGIEGATRALTYDSYDDVPASIEVSLEDGDLVLDREQVPLRQAAEDCSFGQEDPEIPTGFDVFLCGWENGEVRFSSTEVHFPSTTCILDGFCLPGCEPTVEGFCPGEKCSSSFVTAALEWSRLECLPAGDRAVGESCTYSLGANARYLDDCARGGVCVEGVCAEVCADETTCDGGEACATPAGHALELKVCTPA